MQGMNALDKLEAQLEMLIEGAFARLFRRPISARDIAILLLRAMEDSAAPPLNPGDRPLAPSIYRIELHPDNAARFLARFPDVAQRLARIIKELSAASGYQLLLPPQVALLAAADLAPHRARISAEHRQAPGGAPTEKMPVAQSAAAPLAVQEPQLHIGGDAVVPLVKSVVNIGREHSNDVVIETDPYISRHHLQLRKRYGAYTLFDVNSRGGTRVNDTTVNEHRLQNGDVIHIGKTALIYVESGDFGLPDNTTQILSARETSPPGEA